MREFGIFDVLGPIMVGPSSSHTAGACRLGKLAANISSSNYKKVVFNLHGSFAKTSRGHGTDRALLAGVMGMSPDDSNLPNSFEIAKQKNLNYEFKEIDLGHAHPNSVKIDFILDNGEIYYIIGSSIGGGNITITNINGVEVSLSGEQPTIIIKNYDKPGVIAHMSNVLYKNNINIATIAMTRNDGIATNITEVDSYITDQLLEEISEFEHIIYIKKINPLEGVSEWLSQA